MESNGTLSLIVFSGTDDKLASAAILTAGAAALGRPVNIFLQYWGLDAFRAGGLHKDHGASAEAGPEGARLVRASIEGDHHWSSVLTQAKEIGEVTISACAKSLEMFEMSADDLDPIVDGITGIATFVMNADGPIVFI